jgi:DNA invertase Pin-like site-specific DNA recombinase
LWNIVISSSIRLDVCLPNNAGRTRYIVCLKNGEISAAHPGGIEARPDDTVVVTRLDRLARSTRDLLKTLDRLAKARVGFKSLRETAVDTTSPQGRLVVSILAAISEFERELILSRISEGRKRARQNGIKFGRKPKLTAYQRQEALERLAEGESQSTIARSFNVDRATISRLARR